MKIFKQCWALTKDFKRCKHKTKFLVCKTPTHRFQILSASVIIIGLIITIIGIIATIYSGITSSKVNDDIYINTVKILSKLNIPDSQKDKIIQELKKKIKDLKESLETYKFKDAKEIEQKENAINALKDGNSKEAIKLFDILEKKKEYELSKIKYNKGNAYYIDFDFKNALNCYLEASKLDPKNPLYLSAIGYVYHILADYKKAIEYSEKALKINLKTYGEDHPKVASDWNNLGVVYNFLGEYKKA